MITEDYVSFEVAKLLKENGFQQLKNNCGYFTTEMVYSIDTDDDGKHHFAHQYPAGVYDKDKYIAAPTHQMAMKWLREVHNIFIVIEPHMYDYVNEKNSSYVTSLWQGDNYYENVTSRDYSTYEEAVEATLKCVLKTLI